MLLSNYLIAIMPAIALFVAPVLGALTSEEVIQNINDLADASAKLDQYAMTITFTNFFTGASV